MNTLAYHFDRQGSGIIFEFFHHLWT